MVSPAWKPRLTFFFPGSLMDNFLTDDLRRSSLKSGFDTRRSSENSALAMVLPLPRAGPRGLKGSPGPRPRCCPDVETASRVRPEALQLWPRAARRRLPLGATATLRATRTMGAARRDVVDIPGALFI